MAQAKKTGIALDDFLKIYSDQPIEVVNGEIRNISPPEFRHVRIARDIFRALDSFVLESKTGEVFIEAPYVLEESDDQNWVRGSRVPDVSYVAAKRIEAHLEEHGEAGPLRLALDLAVEIVSTNDSYTAVQQKVADYLRYGVRLVWVIDPQRQTIAVHTPDNPDGHTLHADDALTGDPVLPDWSLPVANLFGTLR